MKTKIIFHTDTPQDTAFTDKLYEAASERVNLAGMTEGEFTVIDLLPDYRVQAGQHIYGELKFKFVFDQKAQTCIVYPAQYFDHESAAGACEYHGESEPAFEDWSCEAAPVKEKERLADDRMEELRNEGFFIFQGHAFKAYAYFPDCKIYDIILGDNVLDYENGTNDHELFYQNEGAGEADIFYMDGYDKLVVPAAYNFFTYEGLRKGKKLKLV